MLVFFLKFIVITKEIHEEKINTTNDYQKIIIYQRPFIIKNDFKRKILKVRRLQTVAQKYFFSFGKCVGEKKKAIIEQVQ